MENLHRDILLDDISFVTSYSKSYISKVFKKTYGMTPCFFIKKQKIKKSKKLIMMDRNKSLSDIASEVGFYDQSHFIKNFKKIEGITPSQYKKFQK